MRIVELARKLRRDQTPEERILWEQLRNRNFLGLKFLRQHPITYAHTEGKSLFFIADFYCAEKKLVVEVDGKFHDFQKDYDENREEILKSLGLQVLRIRNEELRELNVVLKKIKQLTHPPSPSLHSREGVVEQSETGGESVLLLLAAGSSSRMGQSKQLLSINDKPLLYTITETAVNAAVGKVVVVLGSNAQQHQEAIKDLPVATIVNTNWHEGMGSSLKTGVKYILEKFQQTTNIIVLVCDQPFLTANHLKQLVGKSSEQTNSIVASSYQGTIGVPCLFPLPFFDALLTIGNEEGAKKILQRYGNNVVTVPFPKGEIDLDTEEDIKKLDAGY